jgi:hypothetical protein
MIPTSGSFAEIVGMPQCEEQDIGRLVEAA